MNEIGTGDNGAVDVECHPQIKARQGTNAFFEIVCALCLGDLCRLLCQTAFLCIQAVREWFYPRSSRIYAFASLKSHAKRVIVAYASVLILPT